MRLSLTKSELENGHSHQVGQKDRISELSRMAYRKDPVAISPIYLDDGRLVAVVRLTEDAIDSSGRGTRILIKFRPVWCKLFTVCTMHKDDLSAVVCEFDFGKYWIDHENISEAKLTTSGPGCDPEIVKHSEILLSEMLADENYRESPIKLKLIEFIRKSF